MCDRCRKNCN